MLQTIARSLALALLVTIATPVLVAFDAGTAFAQDAKAKKSFKPRPKPKPLSQFAGKKLGEIQALLTEEKWGEARTALKALEQRRLNESEEALVYRFYAYIAQSNDKPAEALSWYDKAVKVKNGMTYNDRLSTDYTIAQLYMRQEKFELAAKRLIKWHRDVKDPESTKKASQDSYYLMAVAFAQLEKWDNARKPAHAAYKLAKGKPKRTTLEMLVQVYFNKKDYKRVARYFEELIERYPKEAYFRQLSGVYSELDRQADAIAVRQVAYNHGWLQRDGDIRILAQMYLFHNMPYQAAALLEDGLGKKLVKTDEDAYKLLADAWLMSRETEKSFEPLIKAASLSRKGDLYIRLGQAYIQDESWTQAKDALQSALNKGSLDDEGKAHLLLGVTNYNLENLVTARAEFKRAARYEKTKVPATRWIDFVDKKRAQAAAAAKAIADEKARIEDKAKAKKAREDAADAEEVAAADDSASKS